MLSHKLRAATSQPVIDDGTDPNFKQVSLLLQGDGTNGAQNNAFIGEVHPAQYYGSFNGTQYLTFTANSSLTLGTGDFTIEGWFYFSNSTVAANSYFIDTRDGGHPK